MWFSCLVSFTVFSGLTNGLYLFVNNTSYGEYVVEKENNNLCTFSTVSVFVLCRSVELCTVTSVQMVVV